MNSNQTTFDRAGSHRVRCEEILGYREKLRSVCARVRSLCNSSKASRSKGAKYTTATRFVGLILGSVTKCVYFCGPLLNVTGRRRRCPDGQLKFFTAKVVALSIRSGGMLRWAPRLRSSLRNTRDDTLAVGTQHLGSSNSWG